MSKRKSAAQNKSIKVASRPVNYRLRPAKNIERKMMGEVFGRLSAVEPLKAYQYVGFGAEFFSDFALYHQTLGIADMSSIEGTMIAWLVASLIAPTLA